MCFVKVGKKAGYFIDLLGERIFDTKISFQPTIPTGRAIDLMNEECFFSNWSIKQSLYCPNQSVGLAYIDINGNFFPCCSQVIHDTHLIIGNVREKKLVNLIRNSQTNKFLYVLMIRGFSFFTKIICEKLEMTLQEKWVGPCDVCHYIFSNYTLLQQLSPYVDREIEQILYESTKKSKKQNCV
ncbi:SPASM domain-containing protein [Eubacterium aggregans]|uniref:SPASM domain-containing protein n=1 Tax=Eubacterium aggregans TaxID=81409 RepID=UPI003F3652A0